LIIISGNMKKIYFIYFFIFLPVILQSNDFNFYYQKYSNIKSKVTIIGYLVPDACNKCKSNLDYMIDCLKEEYPGENVNVIGFVYAKRSIEVNYFKKKMSWAYPLFKFDYEFNDFLKKEVANDFVVISSDGEVLYQGNLTGTHYLINECKKIKEMIRKVVSK